MERAVDTMLIKFNEMNVSQRTLVRTGTMEIRPICITPNGTRFAVYDDDGGGGGGGGSGVRCELRERR